MTRKQLPLLLLMVTVLLSVVSVKSKNGINDIDTDSVIKTNRNPMGKDTYITVHTTVNDVITHPAFHGFGKFILPLDRSNYDEAMPIDRVSSLLPYHRNVDPDAVVRTINYMIEKVNNGQIAFHEFYTTNEKLADSSKESTGLFFFRGVPGKPFAIICPGGGFSYVGSIHEGFPHAINLSNKGYNAFVLHYRVGGERSACEDLAMAISFIFKNALAFNTGTDYYSAWGSSAGARVAANIGSYGIAHFGGGNLPKPCSIVMAYTGHSNYTENDPPTFVTSSVDDPIAGISVVERRVNALRAAGVEVEFRKYNNAGHGFGLGMGTEAEGWLEYAVKFWERHIPGR